MVSENKMASGFECFIGSWSGCQISRHTQLLYQALPNLFNTILPIYVRIFQEDIFPAPRALKMDVGKTPGPELKKQDGVKAFDYFPRYFVMMAILHVAPPFLSEWIIFIFAAVWMGRYY